ncbi:MAG TPA: hypothetical protein VHV50_11850 [Actinomycetota bacterium]|jgi:hypothetical protein|nr:hypothetical protein [Actinomycetota bacterium]
MTFANAGICEWCVTTNVALLVDGHGRLSTWLIKRVLRWQRELRKYRAWEREQTRAAIEGR